MTARTENAGKSNAGAAEPGGTARENVIGYLFDGDGREVCAVRGDVPQNGYAWRCGNTDVGHADDDITLTLTLRGKVALTAAMAATHHRTTPAELVDRLIAAEGQRIGTRQLADAREGRG